MADKSFSFVQDSSDFVQKIRNIRLEEDTVLVSFDVVQLFTKVPIEESLEITSRIEYDLISGVHEKPIEPLPDIHILHVGRPVL